MEGGGADGEGGDRAASGTATAMCGHAAMTAVLVLPSAASFIVQLAGLLSDSAYILPDPRPPQQKQSAPLPPLDPAGPPACRHFLPSASPHAMRHPPPATCVSPQLASRMEAALSDHKREVAARGAEAADLRGRCEALAAENLELAGAVSELEGKVVVGGGTWVAVKSRWQRCTAVG